MNTVLETIQHGGSPQNLLDGVVSMTSTSLKFLKDIVGLNKNKNIGDSLVDQISENIAKDFASAASIIFRSLEFTPAGIQVLKQITQQLAISSNNASPFCSHHLVKTHFNDAYLALLDFAQAHTATKLSASDLRRDQKTNSARAAHPLRTGLDVLLCGKINMEEEPSKFPGGMKSESQTDFQFNQDSASLGFPIGHFGTLSDHAIMWCCPPKKFGDHLIPITTRSGKLSKPSLGKIRVFVAKDVANNTPFVPLYSSLHQEANGCAKGLGDLLNPSSTDEIFIIFRNAVTASLACSTNYLKSSTLRYNKGEIDTTMYSQTVCGVAREIATMTRVTLLSLDGTPARLSVFKLRVWDMAMMSPWAENLSSNPIIASYFKAERSAFLRFAHDRIQKQEAMDPDYNGSVIKEALKHLREPNHQGTGPKTPGISKVLKTTNSVSLPQDTAPASASGDHSELAEAVPPQDTPSFTQGMSRSADKRAEKRRRQKEMNACLRSVLTALRELSGVEFGTGKTNTDFQRSIVDQKEYLASLGYKLEPLSPGIDTSLGQLEAFKNSLPTKNMIKPTAAMNVSKAGNEKDGTVPHGTESDDPMSPAKTKKMSPSDEIISPARYSYHNTAIPLPEYCSPTYLGYFMMRIVIETMGTTGQGLPPRPVDADLDDGAQSHRSESCGPCTSWQH
ncbi:hypothetical protein M231_01203 [Tremella mesenterica]|uniref:Uncharacterized protein n=1 Tax=Tremella mesenterica TaxID=5217 RepID=A0A4Q1BTX2_TREME|nr:hypothetical protein M231_01203 [Tremella mesenterica]